MNSKTVPVPVRIEEKLKRRLDRAAKRLNAHRSTVMRFAILNQLPQIESGLIKLTNPMPEEGEL